MTTKTARALFYVCIAVSVFCFVMCCTAMVHARALEDFYKASDGNDYAPAFERAQVQCQGCTIELGPKVYPLARTVNVCQPLAIVGEGVPMALRGTYVTTNKTTAFRSFSRLETCPTPALAELIATPRENGILSVNRLVVIQKGGYSKDGDAPYFAFDLHVRATMTQVAIRNYVQGIRLVCDPSVKTNCDVSRFTDIDIDQSEHAGIFALGATSNASLFLGVRADASCLQAERWNALQSAQWCPKYATHEVCKQQRLACSGIRDLSFLGNTWVGVHVATEMQQKPFATLYYAGVVMAGANQFGTAIGAYTEADTGLQWADTRNTIIGGADSFDGAAGGLHGPVMRSLVVLNGNGGRLELGGSQNLGDSMFTMRNDATGAKPWRMKLGFPTPVLTLENGTVRGILAP